MALPGIPWLLLSLLVAVTPVPCACDEERARMAGSSLIQCYDALTNATNATETEFRASLLPLLAALPSAAAPTGFASLHSNRSVFVRGLCFGNATAPSECLGCLSVAAGNLSSGCGTTTRRAGVWTGRCFLAYADTDASSPAEDAFRSRVLLRFRDADAAPAAPVPDADDMHAWLVHKAQRVAQSAAADISGAGMLATANISATPASWPVRSTVRVLAQCARDRTAAECARCLQDSAEAVDWDIDADRRDGGVAAAVVGFNCYLRFEVSTAQSAGVPQKNDSAVAIPFIIVFCLVIVFGTIDSDWSTLRAW